MDLNETYISYHVLRFCTMSHFEKTDEVQLSFI